jgi:hypothetical protein
MTSNWKANRESNDTMRKYYAIACQGDHRRNGSCLKII